MLSLYNINCIYIFKVDHLVLHNQLVCSSLGKTISLALCIPQLPVVLCEWNEVSRAFACLLWHVYCWFLLCSFLGSHVG